MRSLLSRRKAPPEQPPAPSADAPVTAAGNCLLLLVPEGASNYRLAALADVKTASAFVDANLVPGQSFLSFLALDPDNHVDRTGPGEALVLVRDQARPDIVQPYSFTDVNAARGFIDAELAPGVDAGLVFIAWVEPVEIPRGTTLPSAAPQAAAVPKAPAGQVPAPEAAEPGTDSTAGKAPGEEAPRRRGPLSRVIAWPGWDGLGPLVVSAALGRRDTYYRAMDGDDVAVQRAALIVTLGAISAAVGSVTLGGSAPAWHFAGAILGWSLSVFCIYFASLLVATNRLPSDARRCLPVTLGFAYAPALLLFLGIVPVFGPLLLLGILIWVAATSVVATMTALELEAETAIIVSFTGWVALFGLTLVAPLVLT